MKDGNIRSFTTFHRLNESTEEDFDVEYIRNCFADISDEFDLMIREEEESGSGYSWGKPKHIKVLIELPRLAGKIAFDDEAIIGSGLKHSISSLIKASADLNRLLEMVDLSIKRLSEEYPEYKFTDNELLFHPEYGPAKNRIRVDSNSPMIFITITK